MSARVDAIAASVEALVRSHERQRARRDVFLGLVGRGIQMSRTPDMHEREAARQGMSCAYLLLDFDQAGWADADLAEVFEVTRRLGFRGLNITYPFKQAVMPFLDEVSDEAALIGAVNTVVIGPTTSGYNTDCSGFAESFRREMPEAALEKVAIFGAGGAGSAVATALLGLGAGHLTIIDPDTVRARDLVGRLTESRPGKVSISADDRSSVESASGVVNTTPIGMAKLPGMPFPADWLEPRHWVADVVYFPRETELLRQARKIGCNTLPGIGMAIGQAAHAFQRFTGRAADMKDMAKHFEAAA